MQVKHNKETRRAIRNRELTGKFPWKFKIQFNKLPEEEIFWEKFTAYITRRILENDEAVTQRIRFRGTRFGSTFIVPGLYLDYRTDWTEVDWLIINKTIIEAEMERKFRIRNTLELLIHNQLQNRVDE